MEATKLDYNNMCQPKFDVVPTEHDLYDPTCTYSEAGATFSILDCQTNQGYRVTLTEKDIVRALRAVRGLS